MQTCFRHNLMAGFRFQCCRVMTQPVRVFRTIHELVATREALGNLGVKSSKGGNLTCKGVGEDCERTNRS